MTLRLALFLYGTHTLGFHVNRHYLAYGVDTFIVSVGKSPLLTPPSEIIEEDLLWVAKFQA